MDEKIGHGMEEKIRDAIENEFRRQAEDPACDLRVERTDERLKVEGEIDLDALVFVVVVAVAGGP